LKQIATRARLVPYNSCLIHGLCETAVYDN